MPCAAHRSVRSSRRPAGSAPLRPAPHVVEIPADVARTLEVTVTESVGGEIGAERIAENHHGVETRRARAHVRVRRQGGAASGRGNVRPGGIAAGVDGDDGSLRRGSDQHEQTRKVPAVFRSCFMCIPASTESFGKTVRPRASRARRLDRRPTRKREKGHATVAGRRPRAGRGADNRPETPALRSAILGKAAEPDSRQGDRCRFARFATEQHIGDVRDRKG